MFKSQKINQSLDKYPTSESPDEINVLPITPITESDPEFENDENSNQDPGCKPLSVYIDGPYGAPASQIFRAKHAVLIGTGIGVTPYASILQSIIHRYWQAKNICPKCHYHWTDDLTASIGINLRKVTVNIDY